MNAQDATIVALTMGETAGIGAEIALKAWRDRGRSDMPAFVYLGDVGHLSKLSSALSLHVPVRAVDNVGAAAALFDEALPVLPVTVPEKIVPGRGDPANAASVIEAIDRAVALARNGEVHAVVTNPINKAVLYEQGFEHPGHTEYLAALCGCAEAPVMLLACDALRVVPVTIHLSLAEAVTALNSEAIVHCGRVTATGLAIDFGIAAPRLAVAGLNPHAGEDGHLGREEIDIIAPAIDILRGEGIDVRGPLPADTLFHDRAREDYDAVLCMYHDQALIPLKTLDFDGGVNVTLGLPIVRSSPDHGTGYDIAGKGVARPDSLIAALSLAGRMARNRSRVGG